MDARVIATEWGHAYNIRCNSAMPTIKMPM